MGIQGLLPQLKSIMAPIGVEALKGQTVAVDTYSWLHKGALSCGDRLCKGLPTTRHIEYCMHRVNMLRHHGVKPILIFDGGHLPMKGDQEMKRERSRKENLERAKEHETAGNSRAAFECYQKAVDITPRIAFELIQVLKQEKVDYIVAPYEADAQMTFLSVNKLVDAVITEDSDLIPFGCSRIIFKMDKFGQGVEFHITRLQRCRELDLNGFTKQMLLEMCILSGCDYLPSLPGMGVKRAHTLIQKLKSHEKVIKHLRYSAVSVPPQYEENFRKAIWAFQFQRVYDPVTEDIVHLSGIPHGSSEDLDFLGPWLPQTIAKGIALGNIDPITKEPFEGKTESSTPAFDKVHLNRESSAPSNGKKRLDLPVQRNVLTNYFCLASLEAKRKFRAPKVTPKQQVLNGSLSSPRIEDSCTPDSIEDTSLPSNNIQVSQCSSGTPLDDSINTASQCTSERVHCDIPRDDSASVSPQCSHDIGSDPAEYPDIEGKKVKVNYCNRSTIPPSSCLEWTLPGISDPFLDSHNTEPSRAAPHYAEKSNVTSANRNITVRSSYFKTVNKRVCTNQGEDECHDEDNCEIGNCTLPGDQQRSSGGILKRRKFSDTQNFEDGIFQSTSPHESPPVVDQGCDTDSLDGINSNSEGKFGCNVSHVNKYSGIAEKSMDKFAALISSFRYVGSRASGLRAPLKDVKNTLPVRSVLRPPEQRLSCTAKKTTRVPLQSRFSSDATNSTDVPDLSTFAYRPTTTVSVHPDQGKITNKATDADDGPPDLRTFAPSCEEPLLSQPQPKEKSALETFLFNLRWKNILVLMAVWSSFLVLQILKNNSQSCSTFYWVINILQVPVALSVFLWEAIQLCRESCARRMDGNWECVCEASIEWSPAQLIFCAFCGLLGGTVGGLLGSGGGFILGPLLLELGCIPQVASATATFVMMFSSSLSVVEFYFLHRFPIPFAVYLISISILAGFWGQSLVRKLVHVLKRASLIVFILSSVIFASALTMGVVGTQKSISMINNHEYMGFLDFCEN